MPAICSEQCILNERLWPTILPSLIGYSSTSRDSSFLANPELPSGSQPGILDFRRRIVSLHTWPDLVPPTVMPSAGRGAGTADCVIRFGNFAPGTTLVPADFADCSAITGSGWACSATQKALQASSPLSIIATARDGYLADIPDMPMSPISAPDSQTLHRPQTLLLLLDELENPRSRAVLPVSDAIPPIAKAMILAPAAANASQPLTDHTQKPC